MVLGLVLLRLVVEWGLIIFCVFFGVFGFGVRLCFVLELNLQNVLVFVVGVFCFVWLGVYDDVICCV